MATITTRVQGASPKGSPLTNAEVDDNFINLNTAKYESGDTASLAALTLDNGQDAQVLQFNSGSTHRFNLWVQGTGEDYLEFRNAAGYSHIKLMDVSGVVVNDSSDDLDFRVESNGSTHMLFVDATNDRVGVNISGPTTTLDVSGIITGSDVNVTQGGRILRGRYSTGSITTFGSEASSGGPMLGYGVWPKANTSQAFVSSSNLSNLQRSAIQLSGNEIEFWFGASQTVAEDADVAIDKKINLSRTEFSFNEDGANTDFRFESDAKTHMLFVDASANAVGIDMSAPFAPLTINSVNAAQISYDDQATTAALVLAGTPSLVRLQFGTSGNTAGFGPYAGWIQASFDNGGTNYGVEPLLLNPYGGRVDIGTGTNLGGLLNVAGSIALGGGRESRDTDSSGSVSSADAVNYIKWANRTVTSTFNSGIALEAPWSAVSGTNWTNNKFRFHLWRSHSNDVLAEAVGSSSRSGDGDSFVLGNTNIASGAERVATGLAVDGRDMYLYGQYKLSLQAYNQVTVNDLSEDVDFRVESNGNSNMLFVDGTADAVGIGAVPSYTFDVSGTGRFTDLLRVDEPIWSYSGSAKHYTHLATGDLYNSQGVVILTTNIPGHNQSGNANMFAIRLSGYCYNSQGPLDMWVGCYAGENNYYSYYAYGVMPTKWHDKMWVYTDANGKVAFQFGDSTSSIQDCQVAVAEFVQGFNNINQSYSKGWNISTATSIPATQNQKTKLLEFGNQAAYINHSKGAVFNDGSFDSDFRVETDTNSVAFVVDGGANSAYFGGTPSYSGANANCGVLFEALGGENHTILNTNKTNQNMNIAKVSGFTNGNYIVFFHNSAVTGSIGTDGTSVTYNTTSDARLKFDVNPITDGTEKLLAMKPVTHRWKAAPDDAPVHGFIAQDMQEVMPEAVSHDYSEEKLLSMDYGRITPIIVAALQDAHKKIAELEARLNELEGK